MNVALPDRGLGRLLSYLLYPVTVSGTCLLGWWLLYELNLSVAAIAIPVAVGLLVCWLFEQLLPYRQSWRPERDHVFSDMVYNFINASFREGGTLLFKAGLLLAWAALGNGEPGLSWWPDSWHPLFQVLLALLVLDFFEYWFHRASHRIGLLWRFHAVHHSPDRLYFFNAGRFHIVDWTVLIVIEVAVLMLLGADARVVALALIYVQVHGSFQHANIRLRLGLLNYLVSGPELHRWHHSKLVEESDHNFGNNVIVWDLLFGTYYLPKQRQVGLLGLLNPAYPMSFFAQFKAPFGKKVDKPADYYRRKDFYHQQVLDENAAVQTSNS